jgi:hypothetical protein
MPEWWALPALDDRNREFFTAGAIVVQACRRCGARQHPPEDVCFACQASEFEWVRSRGEGRVYSCVVVEHAIPPRLAERVPYAVALVELDDVPGVRVVGNVVNADPHSLRIGQRVRAVFEEVDDAEAGVALRIPQWEVVDL